jgi:hypothetical protein
MITAPTPDELRTDAHGRPYFVWDVDDTWGGVVDHLAADDVEIADYWLARVLRDAKPDDAIELVSWDRIAEAWPRISWRLGHQRAFWAWWLKRAGHAVDP